MFLSKVFSLLSVFIFVRWTLFSLYSVFVVCLLSLWDCLSQMFLSSLHISVVLFSISAAFSPIAITPLHCAFQFLIKLFIFSLPYPICPKICSLLLYTNLSSIHFRPKCLSLFLSLPLYLIIFSCILCGSAALCLINNGQNGQWWTWEFQAVMSRKLSISSAIEAVIMVETPLTPTWP